MSRTTFEVPQSRHPFVGLGTGIIVTENGKEEPRILIKFPEYGIEVVTATGEKAKKVMLEMNEDECFNADRIEYAKGVACDVLKINSFSLNAGRKEEKAVFARWLIWDYANNSLHLSQRECGDLFGKDHATVKWGVDQLKGENLKFLNGWRKMAHITFWEKMNEYTKIQEYSS